MTQGNDYWFVMSGRLSADIKDTAGTTLYSLYRPPEADTRRGPQEWVFSRAGKRLTHGTFGPAID